MTTNDMISFSVSASLMLIYHLWFLHTLRCNSRYLIAGWTTHVRKQWVVEIVKSGNSILAVQTLRNWILASTFLATVSMFISFGLLQFMANLGRNAGNQNSFITTIANDELLSTKTILILTCNFLSFFAYAQSIRYFNHVGFAINIPMRTQGSINYEVDFSTNPAHVAHLLNQGARFFTFGTRGFYFAIPLVFWYFGNIFLLTSTVVVLLLIFLGDVSDSGIS